MSISVSNGSRSGICSTPLSVEALAQQNRSVVNRKVMVTALVAMVTNVAWIALDHQSPAWDQAYYLDVNLQWRHALIAGGPIAFFESVFHVAPSHPPLYMLLLLPFQAARPGVVSALLLNTIIYGAIVLTVGKIATYLYGSRASFPAALLAATCPFVYGLSRTALPDILLVLLTATSVLAILISDGFRHRRWAVVCGISMGLAMLTKFTTPALVVGPALFSLALPRVPDLRRQVANALLSVGTTLAIAAPWYMFTFGPSIAYLRSATSGQLSIGTTPHPLTLSAMASFTAYTFSSGVGCLMLLFLVLSALAGARYLIPFVRHMDHRGLAKVAIPISWFAIAFCAVLVSHNQDPRFIAPGALGLAVLAAGVFAKVRVNILRWGILGLIGSLLAFQYLTLIQPIGPAGAGTAYLRERDFSLVVPLDGYAIGYVRPPGMPDYANPLVGDLAALVPRTGRAVLNVCLLETQEVVNANTLGFVAAVSGARLTFTDLSYVPTMTDRQLALALASCPVAVYIRPPVVRTLGRVGTLNLSSAAQRMTKDELSAFAGARPSLPVGQGLRAVILER